MASSSKNQEQSKPPLPPPGTSASILLEKTRAGVRRSTPDSEALASSDDEEHHQHNLSQGPPATKPARRTSWLNEVPSSLTRKASLTANNTFSSASSNPTTPAADQASWGASTSPGISNTVNWSATSTSPFTWSGGIWNADSRKEPPSRLTEVLQSPTSTNPLSSTVADDIINPLARTISGDSSIPFAIPLHPTPKTYRSQSYSVGQLDPETATITPNKPAIPASTSRNRGTAPYSSVQRRSSRPSMLGELGHDPATLGRVREDDDGDTSPKGSEGGYNWSANQARSTIEQLSLENALLRQAASGQLDASRFRDRTLSSASANSGYSVAQAHNLQRIPGSVPEESDLAIEDQDELRDIPGYTNLRGNARRRFSEHSNIEKQIPFGSLENRALENLKKAHWQTSLGFAGISEAPQSRRHSFADVPMRHPSISSSSDSQPPIGSGPSLNAREDMYGGYPEGTVTASPADNSESSYFGLKHRISTLEKELGNLRSRAFAASYFAPHDHPLRAGDNVAPSAISTSLHQAYVTPNTFGRQHSNLAQAHPNQQLFIVTFKCCRADVFYIQEDTGLQVKPGELVIVEADRGTDLGTVAHANISWAKARELKDHFAEEHYKWLMLFSRQNQGATNPNGHPPLGGTAAASAVGGMGPQSQHVQEPQAGEIKPKLIKRLAQNHEIQTLRDKEGNEAKAKRVCQQKVAEHRLNMEILDAEFQMDWKKLTFYYFADSYINFNSLVTDLFKIYKTRIWMSAINPASFVTPSAGLAPPGAAAFGQEGHETRRHQPHDYNKFGINQSLGSPSFASDSVGRDGVVARGTYVDPYQAFGTGRQQPPQHQQDVAGLSGFSPQPQSDPFSAFTPPSNNYGMLDPGLAEFGGAAAAGRRTHPTHGEWVNNFHGLSLGS
ncbi:hypothetical protein AJ80_03746 [Polytolypa hystricis UAMH7299]|uniref:PSP1 C-terminal domain-containing protein n=1 Tax=Polytolypa hystricis (strain UAMH7299) TaxID=1447883 RepID=A0A2B7YFH7_POLH7|nr:hypothetical protein AJ80_03746 [Polytolypa hystricis UAMH7299]